MHNDLRILFKAALIGLGLMAGFFAAFPVAQGRDYKPLEELGGKLVHVADAWAREATEADRSTAVFMTLTNDTGQDDALVGVSTPFAEKATLHNTFKNDLGVLLMAEVEEIPLAAGQTVTFKPGGMHIFLSGVRQPINLGMEIPLTLVFASSRKQNIRVRVLSKTDDDIYPAHSLR
ncbi:MAG: copper chaperone PCu(A)C [Proteobacteria bacterium]|nr:copper chaperone PCu(A)C [Pseudomonadota bacterium]